MQNSIPGDFGARLLAVEKRLFDLSRDQRPIPKPLNDLANVTAQPTDGQTLTYSVAAGQWMAGAGYQWFHRNDRTSGNMTHGAGVWEDVDNGLDLVGKAQVGDLVEIGLSIILDSAAVDGHFDAVSVVSGAPAFNWSKGAVENNANVGVAAWYAVQNQPVGVGGSIARTIIGGDIQTDGTVRLRLRYISALVVNRTFLTNANNPASFWAINHGS